MTPNNPVWKVQIGSRSFGKVYPEHIRQLEEAGCTVVPNTVGRAYRAHELIDALQDADAIITGTDELTAEVIAAAPKLKTIAKHGIGLETIDLDAAKARGIVVSATPQAVSDAVADLTLALLLAVARKIVPAHHAVCSGQWTNFTGLQLRGKVMGIVGLGRIGQQVWLRAQGFGMRAIAYDPYPNEAFAAEHDVTFVSFDELLRTADVVTLHAPPDPASGPLLGAEEIEQMKPGALVVNTARGALIDEAALVDALRSGRLGGAGLDAFVEEPLVDSPLTELDNVVLTPHIGGSTFDGRRLMGEAVVENLLRALRGEEPLFRVV